MTHANENYTAKTSLPSYKNPPVNEVVCGLRFVSSDKLKIPHIGLLWDKFRAEYPTIQHAQPIASAKGEIPIDPSTGFPLPRIWFINKSDDQIIQFQGDRFYFNWRRRNNSYPRYGYVVSHFEFVFNTIKNFYKEFDLGEIKPTEYELSYVNHIPIGQGWSTIDDLSGIFTDFVWNKTKKYFLPNPEKIAWQSEFSLPENKGQLTVNLKQATRTEDKVNLLVLELKTRGFSGSGKENDIREWFDLSREWIVKGFTDLTTEKIQKIWERE